MTTPRIVAAAALAFTLVAAAPAPSPQEWSFERVERVELDGLAGDLLVRPGSGADVTLELASDVTPAGRFRSTVDMTGTTLMVHEDWGRGSTSGSVEWVLTVPADAAIEIWFDTTSGSLDASGVSATIEFDSTSGDVRLHDMAVAAGSSFDTTSGDIRVSSATLPARVSFDTTSGDVVLRDVTVAGRAALDTASGDIELLGVRAQSGFVVSTASGNVRVEDSHGSIEASSASGDVWVADTELTGRGEFTSASGNVSVSLDALPVDGVALSSASGDVDLAAAFGDDFTLVLSKRKDRGRIDSPFEVGSEEEYVRRGQAYVRQITRRGSGAPEIRVSTASGTVRVRER